MQQCVAFSHIFFSLFLTQFEGKEMFPWIQKFFFCVCFVSRVGQENLHVVHHKRKGNNKMAKKIPVI